jgi:hypothetical protein
MTILPGLAAIALCGLIYGSADEAAAADLGTKKKAEVYTEYEYQVVPKRRGIFDYPQEPNPAEMSDICAYMYNIYQRRAPGCNNKGQYFPDYFLSFGDYP